MSSDPTTARARRQRAVDSGRATDAVDRVSTGTNPGGSDQKSTSRKRQQQARREIADELDIGREGVGSVDRIRGMDVFLRSTGVRQFGEDVRNEFASSADFVNSSDVDPRVNPRDIAADPVVASNRRDDVADRAREQTAADAQFIEPADLDAEVGDRGVSGIQIADDRRDDVADRTRSALAADDPFANPSDFGVEVGATGIESAGLTDDGGRRRAGRQFESETPLDSVDPFEDVTPTDSGFGLDDEAQRRSAARGFEDELDIFGQGELTGDDIRTVDDGFGLSREPARELAAEQIDAQLPDVDVGVGDIELRETDSGRFEGFFEREVTR